MRRGDLYWVDLEPVRGSEANKVGPAVIVSNDAANRAADRNGRGLVTIAPITSNISRILPFQVLLLAGVSGLTADSKVQAEQVRALSTDRLRNRIGELPFDAMKQIDDAIRLHLAL
ncbi:type II toxin-antitoxin system PemK/MazF family toxin [Kutzneria sp. NPDC052558]|uniref:type II toxin-antitoxin system PemK/MazF family toxin n=1 Tax=Kutzneria sp. NPDC052558 TaxID=3364121 RepID=UPI0037CC1B5D